MIVVVSRFRVANGTELDVRAAFARRPRLVDDAPGFLGVEVFEGVDDAATFYLVTRWTDEASFAAWHGSEAHRQSHAWIPRGIKLDPAVTEIRRLARIPGEAAATALEERVADAAPVLARFLASSRSTCVLLADDQGRVGYFNGAFAALVPGAAAGAVVWDLLLPRSAAWLRARVAAGGRGDPPKALEFRGARGASVALTCTVDVQPQQLVVVGEPAAQRAPLAAAGEAAQAAPGGAPWSA